jgi:hypothetical protein
MAGLWNSGSGTPVTYNTSQDATDAWNQMAQAGYTVPSASDYTGPSTGTTSGGGMNWAGLSKGLDDLSKKLGGQSSGSNTLQTSPSVSTTVSGGTLAPKEAGGGASALASADAARQQLAQYLILSAMQGKGRGKSGGGLLG